MAGTRVMVGQSGNLVGRRRSPGSIGGWALGGGVDCWQCAAFRVAEVNSEGVGND
jgi:hypothetical protein